MSQHEREAFEAWWDGRRLPEGLKPAFCTAWQAALASQQQDHIGDSNKLVQAVNALAAQTGESPESIIEWLTDKGGLTQLMLSYFGGMQSQAQQPANLNDFIQKHVHVDDKDSWTYNSLASSAQDFIDSAVSAFESQSQAQQTESQWISV